MQRKRETESECEEKTVGIGTLGGVRGRREPADLCRSRKIIFKRRRKRLHVSALANFGLSIFVNFSLNVDVAANSVKPNEAMNVVASGDFIQLNGYRVD